MAVFALLHLLGYRYTYFLLIGFGALFGAGFLYLDNEDRVMRNTFKQTTCKIDQAQVTVDEEVTGRGSRRHVTRTYYPTIVYTYSVNGEEYESAVYRAFEMGMSEADATAVIGRYPEGGTAKCYYDPANPDDAVLTLDSDRSSFYGVAVCGLLFLFAGFAGWVVIDFVLPGLNQASKPPRPDLTTQIPEWSSQHPGLTSGATFDDGRAAVSSGPK